MLGLLEVSQGSPKKPSGSMKDYCGNAKENKDHHFQVGDMAEVKWTHGKFWYTAEVSSVNDDGTYGIIYFDGRIEQRVTVKRMRKMDGFKVDEWVEVNWRGMDKWYVAKITGTGENHTYEVTYSDDGVVEKDVPLQYIRTASDYAAPGLDTSGDAVCDVSKEINHLEEIVESANEDIKKFQMHTAEGAPMLKAAAEKLGPPQYGLGGEEMEEAARLDEWLAAMSDKAAAAAAVVPGEPGGAPAPAAPPPPAKAFVKESGMCSDFGGAPIETSESCQKAAAELGITGDVTLDKGGSKYDPPWCYIESGHPKLDKEGSNKGLCNKFDQCLCFEPSWSGFARTEPAGECRTEDGGQGTYDKLKLTSQECAAACETNPACVAFETGPEEELHCEIHTVPVAKAVGSLTRDCWLKAPTTTTTTVSVVVEAVTEAQIKAAVDEVAKLRTEIAGRSLELLDRAKAMGAFDWQLEELKDLLEQDMARLDTPLPGDLANITAEVDRLQKVILDRANRLQTQLLGEEAAKMEGVAAVATELDVKELALKIEQKRKEMSGALEHLHQKKVELGQMGELDPELKRAIDTTEQVVGNAVHTLEAVEVAVPKTEGTTSTAAPAATPTHDATTSAAFTPPVNIQPVRPGAVEIKKLEGIIGEIGHDLDQAEEKAKEFGKEVVPHGAKWWRFRWEYSLVESLIICLLCLIAAFWQFLHDLFRERLSKQVVDAPVFLTDHFKHVVLATWVRYFWGEMVVMLLVVMTVWALLHTGLMDAWIRYQFVFIKGVNLPYQDGMYAEMCYNVVMQLITAVMLFFVLTLHTCYAAMRNDRDCMCLEKGMRDELARQPVHPHMVGLFASSPEEYTPLKTGWFRGVQERGFSDETPLSARDSAREVTAALDERGVLSDGNYNAFPLWYFISERVRIGVQMTFRILPIMWLFCWATFFCFAMLHYFLQVAYIRISIALATISVSVFIYMSFMVRQNRNIHDDSIMTRIPPLAIVMCFQFPLFFLCFVTTRLVVSFWMWMYFFKYALFFSLLLAAFLVVFPLVVSPTIIAYLIKTSFPPHTDGTERLIREVMQETQLAKMREDLRRTAPRAYGAPMPRNSVV